MSTNLSKLICVPITETRAESFLNAIDKAASVANAIELRMDYLNDDECFVVQKALPTLAARITTPLIMTFRPREQGGQRDLSLSQRHSFWHGLLPDVKEAISFADFEIDLIKA